MPKTAPTINTRLWNFKACAGSRRGIPRVIRTAGGGVGVWDAPRSVLRLLERLPIVTNPKLNLATLVRAE